MSLDIGEPVLTVGGPLPGRRGVIISYGEAVEIIWYKVAEESTGQYIGAYQAEELLERDW